ncbi:MAG: hypothetical protein HYW86_02995 [Candidatus Roizmanbacteria bacterium]|nr:MAG: hypothetical protein HYW86_02995 [Candidatus Roizmanbacteria bacterium]
MPERLNSSDNEANKGYEKRNTLNDIRSVGATKPLGYLPFSHIMELGETPENLIAESSSRGLEYKTIQPNDVSSSNSILYVFDREALQKLLDERRQILEDVQWPTEAESFVHYIAQHKAPQETELFDVVADAFADFTNPGRKTFPKPLTTRQKINITITKMIGAPQFARNRIAFNKQLKERKSLK